MIRHVLGASLRKFAGGSAKILIGQIGTVRHHGRNVQGLTAFRNEELQTHFAPAAARRNRRPQLCWQSRSQESCLIEGDSPRLELLLSVDSDRFRVRQAGARAPNNGGTPDGAEGLRGAGAPGDVRTPNDGLTVHENIGPPDRRGAPGSTCAPYNSGAPRSAQIQSRGPG